MNRTGWIRRAIFLPGMLGLLGIFELAAAPGCALSGAPAGYCWSRARIAAAARANAPLRGVATRSYRGDEQIHDPRNWWTKSQLTGKSCEFRVSRNDAGQFVAESNFNPTPVVLNIPMSGVDFYMGQVDENTVLILQQHPGGASATYTNFNSRGRLNYGDCSEDGYFTWLCITP